MRSRESARPQTEVGRGSDSHDRMDQQHRRDDSDGGVRKSERDRLLKRIGENLVRLAKAGKPTKNLTMLGAITDCFR